MFIKPLAPTRLKQISLHDTFSVSVDCDAIEHYTNFATHNVSVNKDPYTYSVFCNQLLSLLDKYSVKATFFCIANQLQNEKTLQFFKKAVNCGHSIGNHTYSHPDLAMLSDKKRLEEITRGHNTIIDYLGVHPVGYRAPAYYINESELHLLSDLGYLYDTSICNAPLNRVLLNLLAVVNRNFRLKKHANLHKRFSDAKVCAITFQNGNTLLEWPIPAAFGLNYYGTFHCVAPSVIFHAQTFWLRFRGGHIHYELHPLELVSEDCIKDFPWLKNVPFTNKAQPEAWMETRLRNLVTNRTPVTLEELSNAYLHS